MSDEELQLDRGEVFEENWPTLDDWAEDRMLDEQERARDMNSAGGGDAYS